MEGMVRPVHLISLLLAVVPLCRYGQIELETRDARAGDRSEAWSTRDALLARSRVFVADGAALGLLDLARSPRDRKPFATDEPLRCRYVPKKITGTTTKFDCELADGTVVKVKYGSGPEPTTEVAATRLIAAVGLAADHMSFVHRLTCDGCNVSPYRLRRFAEFYYAAPLLDRISHSMSHTFEWVSVERKFEAPSINVVSLNGWGFRDLEKVDAAKGGATRAEVDALRLMAVLLAHWDNKPPNQRMVCMDDLNNPDAAEDNAACVHPLLMLQDLGATFGPTKMRLDRWTAAPIWTDGATCRIDFRSMPYHGDGFPALNISEDGRVFLAQRLSQLTGPQLTEMFRAARFDQPEAWASALLEKIALIADRPPCPLSSN
jgi:hypothetical protein